MATRTFGREPALWLTLIATAVRLFSALVINLTVDQQAVLNAFAAAIAGLIIAKVTHRGHPAAILGFVHALLALGVGFGLRVDADTQALVMSFFGAALAMFIRTQVVAPVPAVPAGPNPPVE
jgi:FtsH-binding integral membrane protein